MCLSDAGRKGGKKSGERRLVKGRESVLACRTARELLATVQQLERRAWNCGYGAGRRKGYADANGEAPEIMWRKRDKLGQFVRLTT